MPITTAYKDPERLKLIESLKAASRKNDAPIWNAVAKELSRVGKNRRVVNLGEINKHTSEGDVVVVPGKVLGSGDLDHGVTIAAFKFSKDAKIKIDAIGKVVTIHELTEKIHGDPGLR